MFSTLTLTGHNIPEALTLSRAEDFPSHQFDHLKGVYHSKPTWRPSWFPKDAGHLSLTLTDNLSGGRSAVTYAVEVVATNSQEGGITASNPLPLDQELCIKVARPNRCRTLAREAWIYDKLRCRKPGREGWSYDQVPQSDRLQGVIAPHFYGFFVADQVSFPPWATEDFELDRRWAATVDVTRDDRLLDDKLTGSSGGKDCSVWNDWRPDPSVPMLAIIVMSRGGETCKHVDGMDTSTEKDILEILSDLSLASIVHGDLRPANIVRAPVSTALCERHNRIHKWNIIDFSSADIDDYDVEEAEIKGTGHYKAKRALCNLQQRSFGEHIWYA
ncbi:hypothetical protein CONPUDRAFT_121844 [Coniophora puteana RWD-64-598 SS2]|uniref:Protein kinase domain-containing protein n=1 Tax=Coniophora puteana (strain RWD-64-598) TaxID=741705 RepID=A0A5M3MXH5_CONPW|nr:uncharacterized protein CONPUDRAFT_121844 [Coniophora puteana RWD-64-598 SS2]EIW83331.1 hypothetical protein CONPUDRAFT_121844 [Coniophora puteana RWD-64-598 SS2]